ncbi:MAG: ABC transporter family substrate-binding protein [Microbacterium sp.]
MKQYKLMGALALTGAFALALSGCTTGNTGGGDKGDSGDSSAVLKDADYNPQDRANLKEGGKVTFAINEVPEQLNASNSDGTADTARLASWYMPQVLLMKPDGTPYKNDAYLDEWKHEVKDGKTVLTFTFTKEAHWNDGTDMDWTAIDAMWKANRSSEEGFNPNATDGYKDIEKVEKGDTAKTAIVTFKGAFAWPEMPFLTGVLHPKINTPELFNTAFIDNPHPEWGAGPYTVDKFDANADVMSFKPNPEWWGNKPLLDEVTFKGLDAQAGINAFKNGEVDMVETASQDRIEQAKTAKDAVIRKGRQTANTILMLDGDKPQLKDLDVRKAFFMAINIDQQKQIAWNGLDYKEDSAGSLTLYSFQPGYKDSQKEAGLKFDVEGAKKLLDDAGWKEGADGIREKDGVKLEVTYPIFSDGPIQKALATSLQAQEKEVGIKVNVDVRPSNQFGKDLYSKNWDAVGLRLTASDPFGAAWYCQIYCSDSDLNMSATGTKEIDKKIDEVAAISDPEKQTEAAMKLEPEILKETWGIITLYNGPSIYAVKKGLANLTPEPYTGLDLFGVQPVENVGWEKDAK